MFDNLRRMAVQHAIPFTVGASLMIFGGQRVYLNWIYSNCDGIKMFAIILAGVAIAITILNASHWGSRRPSGNPGQQYNNQAR